MKNYFTTFALSKINISYQYYFTFKKMNYTLLKKTQKRIYDPV